LILARKTQCSTPALTTIIGYELSAQIAKEALETGKSVRELVLEGDLLQREKLDEILSINNLMHPNFFHK
jgi:aspartate ammonia-lyase